MEGSAQGMGAMCVAFLFFVVGLFFTITGIHVIIKSKEKTSDKTIGIVLIILGVSLALGVSSLY